MIVAAGVITRYDWQPDRRFMVRLDIYSYTTENYSPDILTSQSFSVEDAESVVNTSVHNFVLDYVTEQWGMVIDPAVDTIEIVHPYGKAPPPLALNNDKLLAYWKLDEDTGAALHLLDSHAAFDLTNNNGVTFEAGQVGQAARFEAASAQSLSCPYDAALNPTVALTFSCWVKFPVTGGPQGIAGTWRYGTINGWQLAFNTAGCLEVYVADSGGGVDNYGTTPSAWDDDLWHHVVAHIDTSEPVDTDRVTITVDGVVQTLVFTGTIPAAIIDDGGPFTIGEWQAGAYATGLIDECEYRDGVGDLIANWKFDGIQRVESVGENHLTEIGSVLREATTDGGWAATFDPNVPGYLSIDNSPDLVTGDFDWTVSFMAKHDPTSSAAAPVFSFLDTVTPRTVISLVRLYGGQIQLVVHDGTDEQQLLTDFYLDPNGYGGIWAHFRVWYDSLAGAYGVQMDAQSAYGNAESNPPAVGSTRFSIGGDGQALDMAPVVFSGAIRRVAYAKRVWTDEEWEIVYNDGIGQDFPYGEVSLPLLHVRNTAYCRLAVDHPNSTTAKTIVPGMQFSLEPYTNYSVDFTLFTTSNDAAVAPQFQIQVGDADLIGVRLNYQGPASTSTLQWLSVAAGPFTFDPTISQGNVPGTVKISGTIEVGTIGGLLQLGHGSSTATLTTVLRGSWGMLARH